MTETNVINPDSIDTGDVTILAKAGGGKPGYMGAGGQFIPIETPAEYERFNEVTSHAQALTELYKSVKHDSKHYYDTHPSRLGGRSEFKDHFVEYPDWTDYQENYAKLVGKTPALAWAYDESPISTLWNASKAFYNGIKKGERAENIDDFLDDIKKERHDFKDDLDRKYGGIPGTSGAFDYKDWYKYLGLIKSNIRKASERYTDLISRTEDPDTRKQLLYSFDKDRKAYLSLLISALKPYAARGNPSELNPHVEYSMKELIGQNFDDNKYNITDTLITPETTTGPVGLGASKINYSVRANA